MLAIVSVVRDFEMHKKCICNNPYCKNASAIVLDNRKENAHIPVQYNRFIDSIRPNDDQWIMFCHEDFQLKEDIIPKLITLDQNVIWGPIGAVLSYRKSWIPGGVPFFSFHGLITESEKNGDNPHLTGDGLSGNVDTLDCQCLIVHTSLLQKTHLRFDENLSFDLYAEDFCALAKEKFNIPTKILLLRCHHWSRGNLMPRFLDQLNYLTRKYPTSEYPSTVGYSFGQGRTLLRRLQRRIISIVRPYTIKTNSKNQIT